MFSTADPMSILAEIRHRERQAEAVRTLLRTTGRPEYRSTRVSFAPARRQFEAVFGRARQHLDPFWWALMSRRRGA